MNLPLAGNYVEVSCHNFFQVLELRWDHQQTLGRNQLEISWKVIKEMTSCLFTALKLA